MYKLWLRKQRTGLTMGALLLLCSCADESSSPLSPVSFEEVGFDVDRVLDVGVPISSSQDGAIAPDTEIEDVDDLSFSDNSPDADYVYDQGLGDSTVPDATILMSGELLYPNDRIHSPMVHEVINRIAAVVEANPAAEANVFMKIGDSLTVSRNTLHCFNSDTVDLGQHDELRSTLDYFLDGEAGPTTPFDRVTQAAEVGRGAGWAISGTPSPVQVELEALKPSLAFVHYGTNDLQFGATYQSAMRGFYDNMSALLDGLMDQGVLPIVLGIARRLDNQAADQWVPHFNTVIKGLAQMRQVPFIDLHRALSPLPNAGISGDGVHLNAFPDGACRLSSEGLAYGYNLKNLLALESLHRVRTSLTDENAFGEDGWRLFGSGTHDDPFQIERFPFVHHGDTRNSQARRFNTYSCSEADESGPEIVYYFELEESSTVSAYVFDQNDVDIDVHLLGSGGSNQDCLARNHHVVTAELAPGSYFIVMDSYVDGSGTERSGQFMIMVTACTPSTQNCL